MLAPQFQSLGLSFNSLGGSESGTDCRNNLFSDLERQALSDLFRPTLFLTGILRERFGAFAYQLGCERANISGDIDVFRKTPDDPERFR